MILAHWTYSKQEWKAFVRTERKQKGFISYMMYLLFPMSAKKIPEVKITPELVCIGANQQYFSSGRHSLTEINIREEGLINIIEITYQCFNTLKTKRGEIIIPVPKGKLREAFEVEERLLSDAALCQ
ncbi:hypothetical protein CAP36_15335 [Chitinophagaceae bacterium IBVUCB2]|nr:hypothetical protein CAP36_15335 [Chitinophagaceae bacterium IBVUCB2]